MAVINSFLTGRRRYRKAIGVGYHYPNLLVLQVEKSLWKGGRWVCEWFDAKPDDLNPSEIV